MSSAERIEKFYSDLEGLASAPSLRFDKYASIVRRLITWLMRHQDENVPASAKARVVETMARVRATLIMASPHKVEEKDREAASGLTKELLEMCVRACVCLSVCHQVCVCVCVCVSLCHTYSH